MLPLARTSNVMNCLIPVDSQNLELLRCGHQRSRNTLKFKVLQATKLQRNLCGARTASIHGFDPKSDLIRQTIAWAEVGAGHVSLLHGNCSSFALGIWDRRPYVHQKLTPSVLRFGVFGVFQLWSQWTQALHKDYTDSLSQTTSKQCQQTVFVALCT